MNLRFLRLSLLTAVLLSETVVFGFEPFTVGALVTGGIALLGGSLLFKCNYFECCNDRTERSEKKIWIRFDDFTFYELDRALTEKLHGQHLVRQIVVKALRSHYQDDNPVKSLVLSFHGWSGGGKNFVSDIIADKIYKNGINSEFVHRISGTDRFPNSGKVQEYKEQLQRIVTENVSKCGRQLFIIDEVDKIPKGVIDGIKPFLDYKDNVNGVDYRKSVFIFLSNTGGTDISKMTYEFWKQGKREEITLKNVESKVSLGAYNEHGGLRESDVIHKNLIDYYVPFLPLERQHVRKCVVDVLKRCCEQRQRCCANLERCCERDARCCELTRTRGNDLERFVNEVADDMEYFPPKELIYSKSGCKKVHNKVRLALE